MQPIINAIVLFILAGIAEICGGWLIWQWLRVGHPWQWGLAGGGLLVLYGIIPTWQRESQFGRVYAAYGGIFVVLSILWGWRVDGWMPDRFDLIGAIVVLCGVAIMLWSPR